MGNEGKGTHRSTGSFITFIGKTFGPVMAVTTTIVVSIGYIIAMASVINISGGWVQIILQNYFAINVPWQIGHHCHRTHLRLHPQS